MAKRQLTAQEVRAKSKVDGLHRVAPCLYLRVRGGSAIWTFRRSKDGKPLERSLGSQRVVPLVDAVAKVADIRARLQRGEHIDQILLKPSNAANEKPVDRFRDVAEKLWESLKPGWKNSKHADQWIKTLQTYVYPKLGDCPVGEITTQDVFDVLTDSNLWSEKHETATRIRQRIEAVLSAAKARGLRSGENAATWTDNLELLLPTIPKRKRVVHHAALPWRDVPALMVELRQRQTMSSWALQFTILTVLRTGTVIGARWREFHLDTHPPQWIIPKERMKTGLQFHVPLPPQAIDLLRALPRMGTSDVVFWGGPTRKERPGVPRGTIGPLSNMAMLNLMRDLRKGMTVHGLRSSFRDWAADTSTHSSEVIEMAMAHAIKSDVEAAYRRSDLFDRRRTLMQEWANYLDDPLEDGESTDASSARESVEEHLAGSGSLT